MNKDDRKAMKYFLEKEEKNCFFCKEHIPLQVLALIFVIIISIFIYNFINKKNVLYLNNFKYSISKVFFSDKTEFDVKIKNISKNTNKVINDQMLFEIYDENKSTVFYKQIKIPKKEFKQNENYVIRINCEQNLKFGNYRGILILNIDDKDLKIIEIRFGIRK